MDLEFFKKEVDRVKQVKFEAEEKERKEREESYEQAIKNVSELIENLKPAIEYATAAFNLSNDVKIMECTVPYAYTISIRWSENLDEAVFLYEGHGVTLMFSVNDLINKKIEINKDSLQWIGDAFCSKNSVSFAENLLKRLESNKVYVN